jgi:hypothetical protein
MFSQLSRLDAEFNLFARNRLSRITNTVKEYRRETLGSAPKILAGLLALPEGGSGWRGGCGE